MDFTTTPAFIVTALAECIQAGVVPSRYARLGRTTKWSPFGLSMRATAGSRVQIARGVSTPLVNFRLKHSGMQRRHPMTWLQ